MDRQLWKVVVFVAWKDERGLPQLEDYWWSCNRVNDLRRNERQCEGGDFRNFDHVHWRKSNFRHISFWKASKSHTPRTCSLARSDVQSWIVLPEWGLVHVLCKRPELPWTNKRRVWRVLLVDVSGSSVGNVCRWRNRSLPNRAPRKAIK